MTPYRVFALFGLIGSIALAALGASSCKKSTPPSAVKESDPNYPASCAEAKSNLKKSDEWLQFLSKCPAAPQGGANAPDAATADPASISAATEQPIDESAQPAGTDVAIAIADADVMQGGANEGFALAGGCPAPEAVPEALANGEKALKSWIDYEAKVCSASAAAAGSADINSKYGEYDWFYNNCHDAANCGVKEGPAERTGIVRCSGDKAAYYAGHALNYVLGPCLVPSAACQMVCLFEPQSGQDSNQCCWEQPKGAVDLKQGKGKMCAEAKCMGEHNGSQDVLPVGQYLPKDRPTDCGDNMVKTTGGKAPSALQRQQCTACCDSVVNRWTTYLNDYGAEKQKKWEASRDQYAAECKAACAK